MGNIDYTKNPLVKKFIELETSENKVKNIFLYAGGGYGKTTAIKCLFKYFVNQVSNGEKIVPIYIDVKKLNFNESNPIISYIHSRYSGSDTHESDVKNLFSDQAPEFSKKYTYYVLIDGLNETNDVNKGNLIDIISYMTQISNVRFVVSSRIKETFDKAPFRVFQLKKLNEEQIKDYLDKNFGEKFNEQTEVKRINKSLVEILQIPMFMKTFSKTYDKRSPYPDIYDEKTVRKADILDSYIQKILLDLKERTNSNDNSILEFSINFYLPALAFQMAEENVLNIDSEIVDEKLCLDYFLSFFKGTKKERIKSLINDKKFMPISISSKNFALINDNDGNYSFVHQIWRDFFAAKHIINCMNAEKLDELEISVDENIRQFVGELIRKYDFDNKYSKKFSYEQQIDKDGKVIYVEKPDTRKCECDFEEKDNLDTWSESPIEHFMQQHNMNSAKTISPLVIRNLIEIMKISRNNHITANYSDLDLLKCTFHGSSMSNSIFENSIIKYSNFIFRGYQGDVRDFAISKHNDYCITVGDCKVIKWNLYEMNSFEIIYKSNSPIGKINLIYFCGITYIAILSGCKIICVSLDKECIDDDKEEFVFTGHHDRVAFMSYIEENHILVTGTFTGEIKLWDFECRECLDTIYYFSIIKNIHWNSDENCIYCGLTNGNLIKYELNRRKHYIVENSNGDKSSKNRLLFWAFYKTKKKYIIIDGFDDSIYCKEIGCDKKCLGKKSMSALVSNIMISDNDEYSVFGDFLGEVQVWNLKSEKVYRCKEFGKGISGIKFIYDDKHIIILFFNGRIVIWDFVNDVLNTVVFGLNFDINYISFYDDKPFVLSLHHDNTLRLWDLKKQKLTYNFENYDSNNSIMLYNKCVFYNNKQCCAIAKDNQSIIFRNVENNTDFYKLCNDELYLINQIIINESIGKLLCHCGYMHLVVVDLIPEIKVKKSYELITFSDIVFLNNNQCVFFDTNNNLIVFDIENGNTKKSIPTNNCDWRKIIAYKQSSKIVATDGVENVKVWDIETEYEEFTYLYNGDIIKSVLICCNDRYLVIGTGKGIINVWDTEGYVLVYKMSFNKSVNYLASYLDSSVLVCAYGNEFLVFDFIKKINYWSFSDTLAGDITNCNFSDLNYIGENIDEFYEILFCNGADVPKEYEPKPIPFKWNDEELNDKESE